MSACQFGADIIGGARNLFTALPRSNDGWAVSGFHPRECLQSPRAALNTIIPYNGVD